jgi:anti-sigma regulatory factor (Ser/Thr protein kinase)
MPSRHSFAVRNGRDAPAAVRAALRERAGHLAAPLREDLLLLLTEVVTNSVRHSGAVHGAPIEVVMREGRDSVYVVVTDPGDGFERPQRLEPDLSRTGGLGLVLVDRLSRAWGTRRTKKGSLVWFELAHDRDEWRPDGSPA